MNQKFKHVLKLVPGMRSHLQKFLSYQSFKDMQVILSDVLSFYSIFYIFLINKHNQKLAKIKENHR